MEHILTHHFFKMWIGIKLLWFGKERLQVRMCIKFQEGKGVKMKKLHFNLKWMTISSLNS